jgi:hypothetical protein
MYLEEQKLNCGGIEPPTFCDQNGKSLCKTDAITARPAVHQFDCQFAPLQLCNIHNNQLFIAALILLNFTTPLVVIVDDCSNVTLNIRKKPVIQQKDGGCGENRGRDLPNMHVNTTFPT